MLSVCTLNLLEGEGLVRPDKVPIGSAERCACLIPKALPPTTALGALLLT